MEGIWQDHERINEQQLAKDLSVSRTSIRKALQALEGEGLVRSIDNRGMIVTFLTPQIIQEVYQCRKVLELEWFYCLQTEITQVDLRRLLTRLNQLRSFEEVGQQIDIWQVEREIYQHLFHSVDIPIYEDMWGTTLERLRFLTMSPNITGRQQQIYLRFYRQLLLGLSQANQEILAKLVTQALDYSQALAMESVNMRLDDLSIREWRVNQQIGSFICSENDCPLLTSFHQDIE